MIKKILLILFLLSVSYLLFTSSASQDQIAKQVFILDKSYENLSFEKGKQKLALDFPIPTTILIRSKQLEFPIETSSFSLSLDIDNTIRQIQDDQRSQNIFQTLLSYLPLKPQPKMYKPIFTYDRQVFQKKLEDLSLSQNTPYIPTELVLEKKVLKIKSGQVGQTANLDRLISQLDSALTSYTLAQPFEIQFLDSGQLPSPEQLATSLSFAQKLIGKSLVLKVDDREDQIADATMVGWVNPLSSFDSEKIGLYAQSLSQSFTREPVNAVLQIDNGKVLEFQPARDGITFDIPQLGAFIKNNLEAIQASSQTKLTLDLPHLDTPPAISNESVNNLGIKELLGRGKSTFKHSSVTRNHNIATGAGKVNRILVAPGETFSFTKNLGPVDASTGFKEAYVIKGSGTELEYGGGVCQVSTTLFRAMLNSGVNITQRKNHTYRVSYYEEDMPPGYDATVYLPNPDLQFINDTPSHILVQNYFDGATKTLTYELWGTSDGRKSEIANYRQWGASSAPPARYIDDPTLPAGKLIKTETAVPGLKTSFDWKVIRNGTELYGKTFVSNFVPWAAVYRRGTGT